MTDSNDSKKRTPEVMQMELDGLEVMMEKTEAGTEFYKELSKRWKEVRWELHEATGK